MSKYFGTDGFRGEANVGLTVEHAYRIGRFLGWYYGREHKCSVVIGKDTRRSSYMFENALSAGLTASGADAYLMHVTTTPSVSYIVRSDDFDCGIMISAQPSILLRTNGIKLLNSAGEKMEQSVIDEIENYLDGNLEIPFATGANIGRTQDYSAGRNRYIGYLISLSTHSYKGMKVGLDCANGSTWMMAKNIFDALGADTYVIGNEPDGTNINRDCGSTHIENLQKYVRLNRLDVGFALTATPTAAWPWMKTARSSTATRSCMSAHATCRLRAASAIPKWSRRSCPTSACTRRSTRPASAMKRRTLVINTSRRICAPTDT